MQKENRLRIERLIDGYLEERRALNWSPRTIESYRSHLKVFCDFLAMETGVEDIAAVTSNQVKVLKPRPKKHR